MPLLVLVLATPLRAAELSVAADGSAAYETIQAALADAADGDVLRIGPGTYTERLDTAGKDVELRGDGADLVTVDGGGACAATLVVDGGGSRSDIGITGGAPPR